MEARLEALEWKIQLFHEKFYSNYKTNKIVLGIYETIWIVSRAHHSELVQKRE